MKNLTLIEKNFKTILAAAILIAAAQVGARAATFTVTNLNDSGDSSLRQAMTDANAASGADFIKVTVTGTIALTTALPTITDSVEIDGGSQTGFVVDGQNGSAVRPFNINASGIFVSLRNLTVTRGNGTSLGGGIRIDGGSTVTITNVTVTANTATGAGGINVATSSTLYLINSIVTNNTVTTAGGDGGGINVSSSVLLMTGTTVSGNTLPTSGSSTGGGVNAVQSSTTGAPSPLVRIENSTVNNNSAQNGGGVYSSGGGTLRMSNVTVSSNTTTTSDATVANGGGVYLNLGTAFIRNSTIAGNTAGGTGAGGGIYSTGAGTATIVNTIVADNTAGTAASAEIRATTTTGGVFNTRGTNIIEGTTSGTLVVQNGANITGVDPQLAPLAINGGQVRTQAIAAGSNAYNAGINSEALDSQDGFLTIDGRGQGFARIVGGTVDVGAFELTTVSQLSRKAFDFDGDGRADVGVFRPTEGNWYRRSSGANNVSTTTTFGVSSDKLAPADYDGDGKIDIAVFRDGVWYILQSSNNQISYAFFGISGDLPRPGDFDGDGRADLSVFRPADGNWYRILSSGQNYVVIHFGQNGDNPVLGDYDADGKIDTTVFRPSEGNWYILRSSDSQYQILQFGLNGDIPLSGDFTGDGKADLAVFRPSSGTWYIARASDTPAQNFDAQPFGLSTDIPAPADYDGDGKTDIAVFRPTAGIWYILQSSNSQVNYVYYGLNGDRPLGAAYQP